MTAAFPRSLEGIAAHIGDVERFWSKVWKRGPDDCWPWQAGLFRNGYGQFTIHSHPVKAHRVAYALTYGAIPRRLEVRHKCNTKPCCNPRHLTPGTTIANALDKRVARRQARGVGNGRARLTEAAVAAIRAAHTQGVGYRRLSAKYGVGITTIADLICGRTWNRG